jgi:hypothetical protein
VQSTFDQPCVPIQNIQANKTDAFFSGFMPTNATAAASSSILTYTIRVKDTKPVWFYCSQGMHCMAGMVGAINAYVYPYRSTSIRNTNNHPTVPHPVTRLSQPSPLSPKAQPRTSAPARPLAPAPQATRLPAPLAPAAVLVVLVALLATCLLRLLRLPLRRTLPTPRRCSAANRFSVWVLRLLLRLRCCRATVALFVW